MRLLVSVLLTCVFSWAAWAQAVPTAQIQGTVQDSSGSAVPSAEVKATQIGTGAVRTVTSGADGSYTLTNLPIGPYRLEVSKEGFTKYVQEGITLQVASNPTIDAVLKVGAVTEQVVVQADAAMVETHSTGVGQVVDQERVVDLPLNGRNAEQLVFLAGAATTGVVGNTTGAGKNYPVLQISVGGGQSTGVTYVMDGGMYNDPENNLNMPLPFPDALQEFKVETSALPAQYGLHSAAAVNVVTKSGNNEFHGDAFEFLRNGDFNARNFFAPIRDSLKRNQFGGTFGGPVEKNKLFFFMGYQGTIQRSNPATSVGFVPTAAMEAGDFTAFESAACNSGVAKTLKAPFVNNTINPALFVAPAVKMNTYLPTATNQCGQVQYGNPSNQDEHQGLARLDYQLSDKQSVFARYYATHLYIPPPDLSISILNSGSGGQESLYQSLVLGDTYLFGAGTVNSFRVTGNRTYNITIPDPFFSPAQLGVNMNTPPPNLSYISVTGGPSVGGQVNIVAHFPTTTYQFADDVSLIRGAHQIGVGVNFFRQAMNATNDNYSWGMFSFSGQTYGSGMADYFLGAASSFRADTPNTTENRANYFGAYAQDSWKITPRLSLNYGIRWEPYFPVVSKQNYLGHFDPTWFADNVHSVEWPLAPPGVLMPGDPLPGGGTLPRSAMYNKVGNFAPRFGLVWDPKGDGRMTVRAAYGIFYNLPTLFFNNASMHQPPWGYQISEGAVSFSNPWATYPGGDPFPTSRSKSEVFPYDGTYYTWPLHPQPTYMQQWNITLQKQFGTNWLVSAGYLGNSIVHMWGDVDQNPALFLGTGPCTLQGVSYTPCSSTTTTNQRRLTSLVNPAAGQYYATIFTTDEGETQHYDAMLLVLQRRLSRGVTVLANYTWSHCIGDAQVYEMSTQSYVNYFNRDAARGNCIMVDVRQIFNLSAVAQMPNFSDKWVRRFASDWKVSAIVNKQTGNFSSVYTGSDNALSGNTTPGQVPNLVLGSPYPAQQTLHQWINPLAFAAPAAGTYGNLGAAVIENPGIFELDMSLSRIFQVREKQRLEVRAEAFNILNHPNFAAPNLTESAGTFGQITATQANNLGNRIMQFALKYYF